MITHTNNVPFDQFEAYRDNYNFINLKITKTNNSIKKIGNFKKQNLLFVDIIKVLMF